MKDTDGSSKQLLDARMSRWQVREARRYCNLSQLIAKGRAEPGHLLSGCSPGQEGVKFVKIQTCTASKESNSARLLGDLGA